jgi:hypothetical protein
MSKLKRTFNAADLKAILAGSPEATDALRSFEAPTQIVPTGRPATLPDPAVPTLAPDLELLARPPASDASLAPPAQAGSSDLAAPSRDAVVSSPALVASTPRSEKVYRSQGLTVYPTDDELVDEMLMFLRRHKIRLGRKAGFSLFARAGLRLLDELRQNDPQRFGLELSRALADRR